MMELPETLHAAEQLRGTAMGKTIRAVTPGGTPHKFAWFSGNPADYGPLLAGKAIAGAAAHGMFVHFTAQAPNGTAAELLFGDGVRLQWLAPGEARPKKFQLLFDFEDDHALVCSVQMYGGMWACPAGGLDNPYWQTALEKPSPLTDAFTEEYFAQLALQAGPKASAKVFLATQQRVPGLGNGVLQDILYNARIHPKTPIGKLNEAQMDALYRSVKTTLGEMAAKGGRNTEKDLFGCPGGYPVALSAKTAGTPCPVCKSTIEKAAYMGGSVYFCPTCQPLAK